MQTVAVSSSGQSVAAREAILLTNPLTSAEAFPRAVFECQNDTDEERIKKRELLSESEGGKNASNTNNVDRKFRTPKCETISVGSNDADDTRL